MLPKHTPASYQLIKARRPGMKVLRPETSLLRGNGVTRLP